MQQDRQTLPRWREAWFFLALLATLWLGVAGLAGSLAAYYALRATLPRLPGPAATTLALAAFVVAFKAVELLIAH